MYEAHYCSVNFNKLLIMLFRGIIHCIPRLKYHMMKGMNFIMINRGINTIKEHDKMAAYLYIYLCCNEMIIKIFKDKLL